MKKNYRVLIAVLLIVSLSAGCTTPSAESDTLERADKQLAADLKMYQRVWDKVVNERRIELINAKHFDENVTAVVSPENIVGIKAFRDYYNNYLTGFSDAKFTIIDAFGQGNRIVKHWNFKGTHDGNFCSACRSQCVRAFLQAKWRYAC